MEIVRDWKENSFEPEKFQTEKKLPVRIAIPILLHRCVDLRQKEKKKKENELEKEYIHNILNIRFRFMIPPEARGISESEFNFLSTTSIDDPLVKECPIQILKIKIFYLCPGEYRYQLFYD